MSILTKLFGRPAIEYSVVTIPADGLAAQLNSLGAVGWDVIEIMPLAGASYLIFAKREKN